MEKKLNKKISKKNFQKQFWTENKKVLKKS